jgi:hypothetical protein
MKKTFLALCLAPTLAGAQDFIRYYPAPVAGTSGGGATFTAPALFANGTSSAPSMAFASETGSGFYLGAANTVTWTTATIPRIAFAAAQIQLNSSGVVTWGNNANVLAAAFDVSLYRAGPAILQLGATAATATSQTIKGPDSSGATIIGGNLTLKGGAGTSGIANGGAVILSGGDKSSTGEPGAVAIADGGTKPTCDAARRGSFWYDAGGAGVADTFEICSKSAADAYAWRSTSVLIP